MVVERSGSARGINEAASLLACVDDESYKRAIIQDASSILERILFPMCFPWNHSIIPAIRNFPKDIDELPAILHADNEEYTPFDNGVFGYGGFEVGKDRRPSNCVTHEGTYLAATRRTDDVGVIELTVIDNDCAIEMTSRLRKRRCQDVSDKDGFEATSKVMDASSSKPWTAQISKNASSSASDSKPASKHAMPSSTCGNADMTSCTENGCHTTATDLVLPAFTHAQVVKKQKLCVAKENAQRLLVSVRFGSVSSRSSLFEGNRQDKMIGLRPLLLEAMLPSRKNRNNVYDCDSGELDADRANWLKRDNLSWTESGVGGYLSKLSGNTLPSIVSKKPREVRVGVKLNDRLLSMSTGRARKISAIRDG